MKVNITIAKPVDAAGIAHVRRTTWLATYPNEEAGITIKDIEEALNVRTLDEEIERTAKRLQNTEQSRTWIAKIDGTVVGFVAANRGEERNRIGALYILPAYQQRGIGKALMHEALNWLGNSKDIFFEVVTYNTKAIAFYKKLGFTENGIGNNPIAKLPSGKELPEVEMVKRHE